MAENKQYLSRVLSKGTLLINEDVLESIVINAVKEVEGVAGLSFRPALDVIDMIGKKSIGKALKIIIDYDNSLKVICNINIYEGHKVVETATAAQSVIAAALESAVNATVSEVDVNVCGIVRK